MSRKQIGTYFITISTYLKRKKNKETDKGELVQDFINIMMYNTEKTAIELVKERLRESTNMSV